MADPAARPVEQPDARRAERQAQLASERRRSRSRSRSSSRRSRSRSRSASGERKSSKKKHKHSRKRRSRSRSRSRSRDRRRSRSPYGHGRGGRSRHSRRERSRSSSSGYGGYKPRSRKTHVPPPHGPPGGSYPRVPASLAAATAVAASTRGGGGGGAPSAAPGGTPEESAAASAAWAAQQRSTALASRVATAARKAREVYCGNLLPGVVGPDLLRSFLDAALSGLPLPELAAGPPVLSVQLASDGKYAFVEMRSEALATSALQLNGLDLAGRALSVARPAGYVDAGAAAALAVAAAAAAESAAACAAPGAAGFAACARAAALPAPPAPTACVRLDNLVTMAELCADAEYAEVLAELRAEASKHGAVTQLVLPRPSAAAAAAHAAVGAGAPGDAAVAAAALAGVEPLVGKAYIAYADVASAAAAFTALHGRLFDGRTVAARFVWDDELRAVAEAQQAGPPAADNDPAAAERAAS